MTFAGISKPEDRANLIAYLNTMGDSPLPLPAAPQPGANPAAAAADQADQGAQGDKAKDQPILNEAQATPGKNVKGEGAPAADGRAEQTKK
jgi:cytochrome c